jgi:4-hydroxybenzoate polyprenyltransferase
MLKINEFRRYFELMRLHKPAGIFLLLWPCLISLSLASRGNLDLKLLLVFIIGSILMRAAGCIINDLIDYDIDKRVLRTKDRPIASGVISFSQAVKILITLLIPSSLLLIALKPKAIIISIASLVLVVIYPFCKRFTYWPQLVLGLVFNIGVLVAWVEVKESINLAGILLYIGCILWTLGYDTIYAHQDLSDDLKAGVKSTAIKFGDKTAKYLNWFYTFSITMIIFSGGLAGMGINYYAFMALPSIILFWQVNTLDIKDSSNCSLRFKSNVLVGGLIFIATLL